MKPRAARLETPTARSRLTARGKPYFTRISVGTHLGYRKNALGGGSWSVRVTEAGADWVKRIGVVDDTEPADGKHVLSYWQAIDVARALARRGPGDAAGDDNRPATVSEALDRYADDLKARGGDPYNAERARPHLPAAILNKPVALLGANELRKWRDALAQKVTPASVNRTRTCVRAAFELAAQHDHRIENQKAWREGLKSLADAHRARNVILTDEQVRRVVERAYAQDRKFGLLVEVAAVTGARLSQIARLEASDLQVDRLRLMMPKSNKGRVRTKKHERVAVPIPEPLALVLKQEAAGRAADAPLLTHDGAQPWPHGRNARHSKAFRAVATAAGLDPDRVTLYAVRHSSIVRMLLANVPIRIVASMHDTGTTQIERTYSRFISEHSDEIARRALLKLEPPASDNVVPLATTAVRR